METFRDLYIRGSEGQLAAVLGEIERSLPRGWIRDTENEAFLSDLVEGPVFCLTATGDDAIPAATIYLIERKAGIYCITNIVPLIKNELTYGEYNAIVEFFCEAIAMPSAERHGATVEMTSDRADLSDYMPESVVKRLRTFSRLANKSMGSAHPLDNERWVGFITASHREHSTLDATTLRRWLIEVEKWRPDIADGLAAEYESGRELLRFYDSEVEVA